MEMIVVEDPKGEYYEGSLVGRQRAIQLQARGVVLLPVEPDLFKLSGAGGYFRRAWGSGWPLDAAHAVMSCRMVLFCDPLHLNLHWAARLVSAEVSIPASQPHGFLRISADTSQRTPHNVRLTPVGLPVDTRTLGPQDDRGGWTVGGRALMSCPGEGHYGMALYGHAPGMRILWAAVSVTK
jgi:hypothetical protein